MTSSTSGMPAPRQINVYLVILLLAGGWVVTIGWFSKAYSDHLATNQAQVDLIRELTQDLNKVRSEVTEFHRHLDNQTALMARLTGDIIPLQLPVESERRLKRLHDIVAMRAMWPNNSEEAEAFAGEVREIITSLPSWAETHYLEQLVSLRWAGLVFQQLHTAYQAPHPNNHGERLEQIEASFNTLQELVAIAPLNHAPTVMNTLNDRINLREKEDPAKIRGLAMAQAKAAFDKESASETELLKASLWLDGIPESDEAVKSLQFKLLQRTRQIEARQFAEQMRLRHERLKETAAPRPALLRHGEQLLVNEVATEQARLAFDGVAVEELDDLRNYLDAVMADAEVQRQTTLQFTQLAHQRYETLSRTSADNPAVLGQGEQLLLNEVSSRQALLAFDGIHIPELDGLRQQLETAILNAQTKAHNERLRAEEAKHNEAVRAYQQWALRKLQEFERRYNVRQLQTNSWTDTRWDSLRRALAQLLEIDTRFLDWALAEAIHNTLQQGSRVISQADKDGAQMKRFIDQSVGVTKVGLHEIAGRN